MTEPRKAVAPAFAQDAAKQFEFMSTAFGRPESSQINLVEMPDDAVSATWAPEIAGLAAARVAGKTYSPAGEHPGTSVVGFGGFACDTQRCMDHQWHVALWRAYVRRGLCRKERV